MNNIAYIIHNIQREIPHEVLIMTFANQAMLGAITPSTEHLIRDTIIDKWVLKDTDMLGGIETVVDLSTSVFNGVVGGMIVNIHPQLTAGRKITSVLSIGYGSGINYNGGATIASAAIGPDKLNDARVQLVGPNVIFIEGGSYVNCTHLRCVLENNTDYNNISARLMPMLSDLCILATKAHVYNTLIIKMSTAVVIQGIDMAKILDVVSGYADSITMYKETLLKFIKANLMNDKVSHNRIIRMLMPR